MVTKKIPIDTYRYLFLVAQKPNKLPLGKQNDVGPVVWDAASMPLKETA
jgi:hypothetical protein